jgi:DNA-binding MarR family transcriptional regulator
MAAECLCFRARRASRLITRIYDEALRPLGIQATQLTLLNAVTMFGERGATMARLADVLAMDQTTLSRNLRPLAAGGLLRVAAPPSDRRVRVATLTAAGRRMVADALPLWEDAHERVVDALGVAAASELRDRFDQVAHATRGSGAAVRGRLAAWVAGPIG